MCRWRMCADGMTDPPSARPVATGAGFEAREPPELAA
jgi:hypothetical protein